MVEGVFMKGFLEQIYGNKLEEFSNVKYMLPLYLQDGRAFYKATVSGHSFVIVFFQKLERFNIKTLKKQLIAYRQSIKEDIVYGFEKITTFQRKCLIENEIPFVSQNNQMYLPFLGVYFEKCINSEEPIKHQFMPVTQLLFLLFLYGDNRYSKSVAADKLRITPMSITRASKQLVNKGLIKEEKRGTEVLMIINEEDRKAFYEKGEPYLINPIQSTIYVPDYMIDHDVTESGEFSLSKRTDLGYPAYMEYALYKDAPGIRDMIGVDPDLDETEDIVRIQKWKYDPALFSINSMVDPVSLISSLKSKNDDRIHKCLEQVKEEIWSWQIIKN